MPAEALCHSCNQVVAGSTSSKLVFSLPFCGGRQSLEPQVF